MSYFTEDDWTPPSTEEQLTWQGIGLVIMDVRPVVISHINIKVSNNNKMTLGLFFSFSFLFFKRWKSFPSSNNLSVSSWFPAADATSTLKNRQEEKVISPSVSTKLMTNCQRDAAAKLGVPQATLCRLHKQWETMMAAGDGDRKQMRAGKAPVV